MDGGFRECPQVGGGEQKVKNIVIFRKNVYFCGVKSDFMPKIYEYFGIIFFLYPNDHEPIHAHAISGGNETIFELHFENGQLKEIKTRKKRGKEHLPKAKMEQAKAFVEEFAVQIAEKWYKFYILKETLTPEKITKKI